MMSATLVAVAERLGQLACAATPMPGGADAAAAAADEPPTPTNEPTADFPDITQSRLYKRRAAAARRRRSCESPAVQFAVDTLLAHSQNIRLAGRYAEADALLRHANALPRLERGAALPAPIVAALRQTQIAGLFRVPPDRAAAMEACLALMGAPLK